MYSREFAGVCRTFAGISENSKPFAGIPHCEFIRKYLNRISSITDLLGENWKIWYKKMHYAIVTFGRVD